MVDSPHRDFIPPGTRVRVRSRFDGSWVGGFEVSRHDPQDDGGVQYRLRRVTDGAELPSAFQPRDVASGDAPVAPRRPPYRGSFWPGLP